MAEETKAAIPVRLKTLKREEFTVNVDEAALVSDLKKKIEQEKANLFQFDSSTHLQLVCAGKVLKDEDSIKNVYDPANKAAFMVAIAKKSPASASTPAPAVSNKTASDTAKKEDSAQKSTGPSASTGTEAPSSGAAAAAVTPAARSDASGATGTANPHQQALEQNDALIKNIVEMGYPRAQVEQALILSHFNGDRAVQLLCDGMPLFGGMGGGGGGAGGGADLDIDPNDPGAAALMAAAAAALGGNIDDDDEDDDDEDGNAGGGALGGAGGGGAGLGFLRQLPQFEQMRNLVQQNPSLLPQLIQQIGVSNPELLQMIQGNQEEFIQLLNDAQPAAGGAAGGGLGAQLGAAAAAAGNVGGGAGGQQRRDNRIVINLTQADRDAIDRLKNMGFEEALVVQAYFACDKDENAAANFLLTQLQDD